MKQKNNRLESHKDAQRGGTPNPKGGVRHVIPFKGNYCDENSICPIVNDTTEGDWENEGGVVLPDVDDNSSREELDKYRFFRGKHGGCFDDRDWFDKDSRMV